MKHICMKNKVKLSLFCFIITYFVLLALIIGVFTSWGEGNKAVVLLVILVSLVGISLYFFPKSIESNDNGLIIHCQYNDKAFAYSDIEKVERCYPSAGGLRLCGSGGFFGYWGYFTDIVIGNYFGYYGNRSQCILIKLKDGKQYVISCENPDKMVNAISSRLN